MTISKQRVLFVEPLEIRHKKYAELLNPEKMGWELTFSSSAVESIEMHHQNPFDIVVSAFQLPDNTGTGLLRLFKESSPETIRFLMVEEAEKRQIRSLVGSAQQILKRPINPEVFTAQVNRALKLRRLINNPEILGVLGNLDSLPTLPRIFEELSNLLKDPNASLQDVAQLIAQDIVLSTKILKLANSALFSLRMPAQNIMQAVPLLGSSAVSSLVFSQSVYNSFEGGAVTEEEFDQLNHHSLECAAFSSKILKHWGAKREAIDNALFCGIAHDLGNLVLARYAPEKWLEVKAELRKGLKTDTELEQEIIGITHTELAAYLLAIWGFSNEQIIAIAFHHHPSKINETEFGLLGALHIAEFCCTDTPHPEQLDWDYLSAHNISEEDIDSFKALYQSDD